jgi:hypothetical protein
MRNLTVFYLLFVSLNVSAQPGDIEGMRKADFMRMMEQLKNEPNNYELIWRRLEEFAHPHFDLYSRSGIMKIDEEKTNSLSIDAAYINWTPKNILSVLNKLIDNKVEINKALKLCNSSPRIYGTKRALLGNLPNHNER